MPQTHIHVHMDIAQLLKIPFDGCIYLIGYAAERGAVTPDFLRACYDAEASGKARHPVLLRLKELIANPPKVACAACDRGDFQLGHADGCSKA